MHPYDQDWGSSPVSFPPELLDPSGRLKTARGQNVYDVDFEYGMQPLRWENLIGGGGTIVHRPIEGGVRMTTNSNGDFVIRQSKPYFRYQPSKGIYASAAVLFGAPSNNITRRVGMFDGDNGVFFEQTSAGLFAVRRSNIGGAGVVDIRVAQADWNLDRMDGAGKSGRTIDVSRIQMAVMDYAWYGAGRCRLGFVISGKLIWCHAFDAGNVAGQVLPWARTGNMPCRYEMRQTGAGNGTFWHWGVSVVVEGGFDDQRGFTFPHANPARIAVTSRRPILSSRVRPMGVIDEQNTATSGAATTVTRTGAGWTTGQWIGRYIYFLSGTGAGQMARIISNTATAVTGQAVAGSGTVFSPVADATTVYQIGLPNRGQLMPSQLIVSSDAAAYFELVLNGTLTGPTWTDIGALSLAQQDIAASAIAGGTTIFGGYTPAGGQAVQVFDLRQLQVLGTNIVGNNPDVLSVVATSLSGTANIAATVLYQEAMS